MRGLVPFEKGAKFAPYLPIPEYIIRAQLPITAMLIYGFMLSRAISSGEKPEFQDKDGVFIYASVDEMAAYLERGRTVVNDAINALIAAGFIKKKRRGLNRSNKYYVMVLSDDRKSSCPDNRKSGILDD